MHKGENHTACLFLSEQGYRHDLFQVSVVLHPILHAHMLDLSMPVVFFSLME